MCPIWERTFSDIPERTQLLLWRSSDMWYAMLSLKSHDPSQRANGFLTLAGGVIITFAKEILDLIMA